MELCTAQSMLNNKLSSHHHPLVLLFQNPNHLLHSNSKPSLIPHRRSPLAPLTGALQSRLLFVSKSLPRETSEEVSSGANQYFAEKREDVISLGDVPLVEKKVDDDDDDDFTTKVPEEQLSDGPTPIFEFLDNINFESEDTYSFLLFGGVALLTLWLASAVVGAIDSIPVFPKLLEIVGLGYTVWFASRYLIFKKRREELVAKIEELKEEVLGSK